MDYFPVGGKNNVVETLRKLKDWELKKFIGITDEDFDDPAAISDVSDVNYPYAEADLESMLIELGVLEEVLGHMGSEEKIANRGGISAVLRDLKRSISPVSLLRRENSRNSWGIPFDSVDLAKKIDHNNLILDIKGYCSALIAKMEDGPSREDLVEIASGSAISKYRGKDLAVAAGISLRKLIGTHPQHSCGEKVVCSHLHSGSGQLLERSTWLSSLNIRLDILRES
ncbi:hypothetical protein JCM9803A_23740 [Rhodococcus erythropolis]